MSESVRGVERTRKPWITQEMISKTNDQSEKMATTKKKGRTTGD
jgi:hypothetical protein